MRRKRARFVVMLTAMATLVTALGAAASADSPASYDVAGGPSYLPPYRHVMAADSDFVIAQMPDVTLVATPAAGGLDIPIPPESGLGGIGQDGLFPRRLSLAGSMITAELDQGVVTYAHIGGSWGTRPAVGRYLGAAPQGWLEARGRNGHDVADVNADDGTDTDLGQIPVDAGPLDFAWSDSLHAVVSALGTAPDASDSFSHWVRHFFVFDLTGSTNTTPLELTSQTLGCLNWPEIDTCDLAHFALASNAMVLLGGTQTVERVPLNGGASTVLDAPADHEALRVAATADQTGWYAVLPNREASGSYEVFDSVSPGSTDIVSKPVEGYVVGDGDDRFYTDSPPDLRSRGLASMSSAAEPSMLVQPDPPVPVNANDPRVTTGWVAWDDDEKSSFTVMMRAFQGAGDSAPGPATVMRDTGYRLGEMAQRRAILEPSPAVGIPHEWLMTGSGHLDVKLPLHLGDEVISLSGTRILVENGQGSGNQTWRIVDLAKGTTTPLPGSGVSALWGNYLVRDTSSGIVRFDLSGRSSPVLAAAPAADASPADAMLYVAGDYVAWNRTLCDEDQPCRIESAYRDVTHNGPIQSLDHPVLALSDSYLATQDDAGDLVAINLTTGERLTVSDGAGPYAHLDANLVGWVTHSASYRTSEPMVTRLPDTSTAARLLGRTGAPTEVVRRPDSVWRAELDASRPLVTCAVTISRGATLVRTLPCDPGLLRYGTVVTQWNLTDSRGAAVSDGRYDWQLSATDDHGPIRDYDGVPRPLNGQIDVHHPVTAFATHPRGVAGHWTVTFTGDVAGYRTSNLEVTRIGSKKKVRSTATCYSAARRSVGCGSTFRSVRLQPRNGLHADHRYRIVLNPAGAHGLIVDAAGDPVTTLTHAIWRARR